jgi:gliding motility-associated lipoprotein GldH
MAPKKIVLPLLAACIFLSACNTVDLYEKNTALPHHEWKTNYRPVYRFNITDTVSTYQLFITLRHDDQYHFNNIWMNLYAQAPGGKPQKFMLELPLATKESGWLGSAMDDLYDHRIALTLDPARFNFRHQGEYVFTLEQIMREDPLGNIFDVGIRLEKKTP